VFRRVSPLVVTANVVRFEVFTAVTMNNAVTRATRRNIPEDGILRDFGSLPNFAAILKCRIATE
jgi:hypothetical protein